MIKRLNVLLCLLLGFAMTGHSADDATPPSNGVAYPAGWEHWATIAVSHRSDNDTIRVILGNEVAVRAARAGDTDPWPDGAILGKVVWKGAALENWRAATGPGQFVHAEFMFKDSRQYIETHGWGWARWIGLEPVPFNDGMQVCIACHTPVRQRDWVFTEPAPLPQ